MADTFSTDTDNLAVRVVVGLTNVLTILGSVLILASYLCFPSLRTGARLILLHLSLMDLVVGLAHFIGGVLDFNSRFNLTSGGPLGTNTYSVLPGIYTFCKIQAFVGYYAIVSSVLWTVCLSVYMHLLSERGARLPTKSALADYHIWISCAACYGIPLLLSLWALLTGRLGYSPYDSAGWCTLKTYTKGKGRDDIFASVIGFDLWIYLAMILITVLYASSHVHRRMHLGRDGPSAIDYKFAFIPVIFVFLRIWTCVLDVLYYTNKANDLHTGAIFALICLTGIGDSAQGFTNAILFVCFTKAVRVAFRKALCPCCCTEDKARWSVQRALAHT